MTDLASLLIKVDSTQADKGAASLDKLAAAGGRAEASVTRMTAEQYRAVQAIEQVARSSAKLTTQSAGASAAASRMITQTMGVGKASGLARHHLQNLTFQLNDVAMALSTGQDPMRVFIQQGSQIAQIGQQAGVGVGGLAKAALRLLAPFAGIATLAAGVGLAFKGVKDGAEAADPGAQKLIETLGLTKKEMEQLQDTSVTWGDVMGATFDVIAERGGTSAEEITGAWAAAMSFIGDFAKSFLAVLIGGFAALVQFVGSAAKNIGLLIAKGIEFGVNRALGFVETLINGVIWGFNRVSGFFSKLGIDFGSVGPVKLGRVAAVGSFSNPFSDMSDRFYDTGNAVLGGFDAIGQGARARRDQRVLEQVDDRTSAGGGRSGASRDAARAIDDQRRATEQALKAAQDFSAGLKDETDSIGKNAIEQKRMEIATAAAAARKAAAVAPTKELRDALLAEAEQITRNGQEWERVTKDQALADYIKNTLEPLERQVGLLGLSAEAQARANLEAEKGAIIAEYGAEAWERYYAAQSKIIDAQFTPKSAFDEWAKDIPKTADEVNAALEGIAIRGLDGLASGITEVIMGTKSLGEAFSDMARQIIADIIQMTIRMLIFRAISGMFRGGGSSEFGVDPVTGEEFIPSAKGNVFSGGNIIPFASGGIVSGPTLFPMSGGKTGLMGEAGPEAVMPLARDSRGRLGVRANDNAPVQIELTVHSSPSPDAWAAVEAISVNTLRRGAPQIVKVAVNQSAKALTQRKLMGGRA